MPAYQKLLQEKKRTIQAKLLPSLHYKDSGFQGDGMVYINEIKGRIRNASPKTLSSLKFKISVSISDGMLLDTKPVTLSQISIAPGDVQSFSESLYIERIPKTFKWSYHLHSAGRGRVVLDFLRSDIRNGSG